MKRFTAQKRAQHGVLLTESDYQLKKLQDYHQTARSVTNPKPLKSRPQSDCNSTGKVEECDMSSEIERAV